MDKSTWTVNNMPEAAWWLLLAACFGMLQYHALPFWSAVGGWPSVTLSILLDVLGLVWWFQRTPLFYSLGALASITVLAVPLYVVSSPIVDKAASTVHVDQAREERIRSLEQDITERQETLGAVQAAAGNNQWAGLVRQAQDALRRTQDEIEAYQSRHEDIPVALLRAATRQRADLTTYQSAVSRGVKAAGSAERIQSELSERRAQLAELRAVVPTIGVEVKTSFQVAVLTITLVFLQLGSVTSINRLGAIRSRRRAASTPPESVPTGATMTDARRASSGNAVSDSVAYRITYRWLPPPNYRPPYRHPYQVLLIIIKQLKIVRTDKARSLPSHLRTYRRR